MRTVSKFLTVILRDDSPLIHAGDRPSYRSVRVELTEDQVSAIAPKQTGRVAGKPMFESISQCFIESEVGEQDES